MQTLVSVLATNGKAVDFYARVGLCTDHVRILKNIEGKTYLIYARL